MRYLLQSDFRDELAPRMEFLYDSFKLWFYPINIVDNFIQVTSIPSNIYPELLMIVGHNHPVKDYLITHSFPETLVVANTCDGDCNFKHVYLPGKKLYIPFQNKRNLVDLLSGKEFGIDFDITESELLFRNSPCSWLLKKRIEQSFQSIIKYRRY